MTPSLERKIYAAMIIIIGFIPIIANEIGGQTGKAILFLMYLCGFASLCWIIIDYIGNKLGGKK